MKPRGVGFDKSVLDLGGKTVQSLNLEAMCTVREMGSFSQRHPSDNDQNKYWMPLTSWPWCIVCGAFDFSMPLACWVSSLKGTPSIGFSQNHRIPLRGVDPSCSQAASHQVQGSVNMSRWCNGGLGGTNAISRTRVWNFATGMCVSQPTSVRQPLCSTSQLLLASWIRV